MGNELLAPVEYRTDNGSEITLKPDEVKSYLTKGNGHVTDSELLIYMNQCKNYKLDPFASDVFLVKYSDDQPAAVIMGIAAFLKRADSNPQYDGMESGVIVSGDGKITRRNGALHLQGETIVGAWATVHRKDRAHPTHVEVPLSEYDTGKSSWKSKKATMIVKVAKSQALRETFPNLFAGMFEDAEIAEDADRKPSGSAGAEQPIIEVEDVSAPATPEKQKEFGDAMRRAKDAGVSVSDIKAWCKDEYDHEITELNDAEINDAIEFIDSLIDPEASLLPDEIEF